MSNSINRAKVESTALQLGITGLTQAMATLDQIAPPNRWVTGMGNFRKTTIEAKREADALRTKIQGLVTEAGELNKKYIEQRGILNNMIAAVERRYDIEIEKQQRVIAEIDKKIAAEQKATDKKIADINKVYNKEIDAINKVYNEKLKAIDAEIALLQKRTPEEQKLYEFEKQSLINKIKSGTLSQEELLRAKAQLSRMEAQEKIDERAEERAKVKAEQEKQIAIAQEKQADAIGKLVSKLDEFITKQETQRTEAEKIIQDQEAEKQAAVSKYKAIQDEQDIELGKHLEIQGALIEQSRLVENLQSDYFNLTRQISAAVTEANKLGSRSLPSNFAGGPISGGTKTHINEFGQEAFLSNSGKLSMIKAKPWDVWTAPSSGTIIPAHIAAGLDIPSSGLNVNGRMPTGADSSGNTKLLKGMLNALKQGGGNTTNNVTIQSTNTSKAASDILVSLARIKRRRYN